MSKCFYVLIMFYFLDSKHSKQCLQYLQISNTFCPYLHIWWCIVLSLHFWIRFLGFLLSAISTTDVSEVLILSDVLGQVGDVHVLVPPGAWEIEAVGLVKYPPPLFSRPNKMKLNVFFRCLKKNVMPPKLDLNRWQLHR